jgi:hypothetical protein
MQINIKKVRQTTFHEGNQWCLYISSESVALFIQHVTRMSHTILSPVTCLAVPYFPALSLKRHEFQDKLT